MHPTRFTATGLLRYQGTRERRQASRSLPKVFLVVLQCIGPVSPVSFISDSLKLSRVVSFQPGIKDLEVGLTPRNPSNLSVTLCLWADESELLVNEDKLVQWGTHWKGPISLLVTTQDATSFTALNQSLENLKREPPLSHLAVHVLHIQARPETYSSNALLNLARLLASTPFVLILPGGLSSSSSHAFRESIIAQHDNASSTPCVIIGPSATLSFPLPELTPLLIRRDFPSWCTERFLYLRDRISNWNECLWQFWMDADGKLGSIKAVLDHEGAPYWPQSGLESAPRVDLQSRDV
ncbi:hypothetical protein E1B28_000583 [Marasmius oreades]|uniref:Uncharacterized protein n=1 Tax=Marasmius oreades TaxID=181124 RepID=A0A9P8AEI8_9AGAR|nr:uncharacterized protein E1B28_000583 [Marasmius oreades]KAG7098669.1 hypothetical protein E1B28_000583 [Marasmius oreades]